MKDAKEKECSTEGRKTQSFGRENRRKKLLASLEVQVTAQASD